MHILLILSALVVLAAGIFVSRMDKSVIQKDTDSKEGTLIETNAPDVESAGDEVTKGEEEVVSVTSTFAPTLPVSDKGDIDLGIQELIYPGSQVLSSGDFSAELSSVDSPDSITDLYKEKLKSLNLNIQTFVVTKNNDNVKNKLVAASGNTKVSVTITKDSLASKTYISLEIEIVN